MLPFQLNFLIYILQYSYIVLKYSNSKKMTTDSENNQSGGTPEILTQEELTAALQKELGEPAGYLDLRYREWCLQQPDEVLIFL